MKNRYLGITTLIAGLVMIFFSDIRYTGAAFGIQYAGSITFSLIGMGFIFCSMIFMASGGLKKKITVEEKITDRVLKKESELVRKNPNANKSCRYLIKEVLKGNTPPRKAVLKKIDGTPVKYFRDINQTRLYFTTEESDMEIKYQFIAVSNRGNQDKVVGRIGNIF